MADNPVRPCFGCRQFDDHPRHELYGVPDSAMHMDCCAELRGCGICARARSGLAASVVGEAFREHVLTLPPAEVTHLPNDNDSDPHNLRTVHIVEA